MDEITTNKDKRMQLRELPSAPIHYFNPEEKLLSSVRNI